MTNGNNTPEVDMTVEEILQRAPPRPTPSADNIKAARNAIRAEWQTVTGRRRTRQKVTFLAVAASIVVAIAIGINVLRVPSALPVHVATISKSLGTIYLLEEQSRLHETRELTRLIAGQSLVTGHDSAAAVEWSSGGTLRIDENSRVEFLSTEAILLHSGRVYFDSQRLEPALDNSQGSGALFAIRTSEGTVSHVGTQYMTAIDSDTLTVSVREGRVDVVGQFVDATATAGQQVKLSGGGRPVYANIGTHGGSWSWVERIVPAVNLDQRSAHDLISWASRETGLEMRFDSDAVEKRARETRMFGTVDSEPRVALQALLQTTDLAARIENGRIIVSER